ncbi:DBIRD complex subunit ZNF326 [Bombina bombina]|uniref:DBIRD complex subunit ZNF326 n=1 Tax=Bombina bombina TaxID=8345 RepID=UPI00235ADDE5|nr:DBIRD complex subunit ZNF326 [Bombina bombina]
MAHPLSAARGRGGGGRPALRDAPVHDYGNERYAQTEMETYEDPSYTRDMASDSRPYESYDSRSSLGGRDLYRSGYGNSDPRESNFGDSNDGRYDNSWISHDSYEGRNQGGSSWEQPYTRERLTDYMDDGRGDYSSYGRFSSPFNKPAAVGSRGRGMPAFGGRSFAAFGGPSPGRGRGRGRRGGGSAKAGFARGAKRKMVQPGKSGTPAKKKQKLPNSGTNQNENNGAQPVKDEAEEQRRAEARKEQQKRRREKYIEKYGDGYWMAFTCSFCKFRSFDEKGIEEHLESAAHKEILEHIQKQTKFDKAVIDFLHESIVNKYKKTAMRKAQTSQVETSKQMEKATMEGVTLEDHMMKVETVHCSACNAYIPALNVSVQIHLKSPEHIKSKVTYKDQIKRESILTATSILNNPVVKGRYERYLKGENPFETQEVEASETEAQTAPSVEVDKEEDFTSDIIVAETTE